MIPQVYEVTKIGNGLLYVMPKPSSEWLKEDVHYLSSIGINKVVSLLETTEEYELGLQKEQNELHHLGIKYLSFPIKDRGLSQITPFNELVNSLYKELVSGQDIAIHCRAGIGRTGMLACCLLIKDQYSAQAAIDMVSAARGVSIPDTQEQYDFICDYEQRV
ncbi:protein-tyrosine phosphatase family protein [Spartinivicinus ruber]|uniref:protein-tyrosine phosphatase family protein n=1 Tax=Spartinivicinus ruber TaxID=2683272 RepID=UPI0013D1DEBC|nr:dual specificity protein phosphatase family protein [Spartinivicinus ruber]